MSNGDQGWAKGHRAMLDHPLLQDADALGVWVRLFLMAARKPARVKYHDRVITLERGEVAFSVREFARKVRVSYKRLRTILGWFEADEMILKNAKMGAPKGAPFSVYSIVNYDTYQGEGPDEGAPMGAPGAHQGRREQESKTPKTVTETPSPPVIAPTTVPPTGGRTPPVGDALPVVVPAAPEPTEKAKKDARAVLWEDMKGWIGGNNPGALMGKWCKTYGEGRVFEAHTQAMRGTPADYRSWMEGRLRAMVREDPAQSPDGAILEAHRMAMAMARNGGDTDHTYREDQGHERTDEQQHRALPRQRHKVTAGG